MTKRKSRKKILYEEAAKLFVQKGYPATSIRGLAEKVGIEPSSIYSHIKSKEDLLVKICMDAAHYFVDGMEEILNASLPVEQTLERLIDLHIEAIRKKPSTLTVFTDEWKHLPPTTLEKFLAMRRGYEMNWRLILKRGMEDGTFREFDVQYMTLTLLSSMRWVQTWINDEKLQHLEEIKSTLNNFIKRGLARH